MSAALQAAAPDTAPHVARYLARVDAHLPALADDEVRHDFLSNERHKWLERYADFQWKVDRGCATDPEVDAADYLITIAELDQRAATLVPVHVYAMPSHAGEAA